MLLRAKYLLWKAGKPPIENAFVEIRGARIVSVGNFHSSSRKKIRDLGEVVLLPGLINAHCHLNYTNLAGKIPPPSSFTEWLRQMIALKRAATPTTFAAATREGLRQLHRSGTTTVCDIVSDTGDPRHFVKTMGVILSAAGNSPLRVVSFLEQLDLGRPMLGTWVFRASRKSAPALQHGLSPHSPYTVSPASLRNAARSRLPLMIHIAESREEWEMFTQKRGALFDLVKAVDPAFTWFNAATPVQYLHKLGVLKKRTLGVHLNHLAPEDFEIIARSRMSVVHCPRSHEYFHRQKFAAEKLLKLSVNICLGTDSAASICHSERRETAAGRSTNDKSPLDMFEEMRTFHRHHPKIHPREILKMATINGARAIGQQKQLGCIQRGKFADLIAVPAPARKAHIEEAIIYTRQPVALSMIGGTLHPVHPS